MSSVSERLRLAKEKSKKRKELLEYTLGSGWAQELGREGKKSKSQEDKVVSVSESAASNLKPSASEKRTERKRQISTDGKEKSQNVEEFRDSTAFLKGTQSLNPHNDYSQNFVDTGQRPQNFISE